VHDADDGEEAGELFVVLDIYREGYVVRTGSSLLFGEVDRYRLDECKVSCTGL